MTLRVLCQCCGCCQELCCGVGFTWLGVQWTTRGTTWGSLLTQPYQYEDSSVVANHIQSTVPSHALPVLPLVETILRVALRKWQKQTKKKNPCPHFILPHLFILDCKTSCFYGRKIRQVLAAAVCLTKHSLGSYWMAIYWAFHQPIWSKNPAVLYSDVPECCILSVWKLFFFWQNSV